LTLARRLVRAIPSARHRLRKLIARQSCGSSKVAISSLPSRAPSKKTPPAW
jgi:hypothetical protein